MLRRFLRKGFTSKVYDFGPLTVVCGSNFIADGSHRWPKIDLILRDRFTTRSCTGGRATMHRRLSLPLPYVTFAHGLKHPWLMPIHWKLSRFYRRNFSTRRGYTDTGYGGKLMDGGY